MKTTVLSVFTARFCSAHRAHAGREMAHFEPCEHGAGHCEVLHDAAGGLIVSAGADSAIVVRDAASGETLNLVADEHDYVAVTALALSPNAGTLVTGCITGIVRQFSFPDMQYQSNVQRFDREVRYLAFSADNKYLAAVPQDSSTIEITDMVNKTAPVKLSGHAHFVRAVSFDPAGKYLASSGGDGCLLIWDTSKGLHADMPKAFSSAKFLKDAKGSPGRNLHRLDWRPDGKVLAVPYGVRDIVLMQSGTWKELVRLKGGAASGGHTEDVSVVAWSPSGRYVASGDVSGRVVFWDAAAGTVIDSRVMAEGVTITSISWDPTRNAVLAANAAGTVVVPWTAVIPADMPAPFETVGRLAEAADFAAVVQEPVKVAKSPVKAAAEPMSLVEDEAADADMEEKPGEGGEEDDETVDEGAGYQGPGAADKFSHVLKTIEERVRLNEKETEQAAQEDDHFERYATRETPAQDAFNSGATPVEDGRRQLAWNLVGRVTAVERKDHSSLEVEFEDTTKHRRPVSFQDSARYTMADLSDTGAVFAAPSAGYSPSVVHFRFFDAWDRASWMVELPGGEEAVSVAVGNRMVVVATSLRQLRIFSYAGLQIVTLAVPGPVVTLAASDTDMLAVVFHSGRGLPTEQAMSLQLWDLHSRKTQPTQQLPLSPGEVTLQWLGYATNGVLVSADSAGVVRGLLSSWDYNWSPIADLSKAASSPGEKLAMVGIHLDYELQHIQAVGFKEARKFPVVLPKPMLQQVPVMLDVLDSSDLQSGYEPLLRQSFLINAVDNAQLSGNDELATELLNRERRDLLKLLITCVKADEGTKLLEACGLIAGQRVRMLGLAAEVANKFHKPQLVKHVQAALAEELASDEALDFAVPAQQEEQEATHRRPVPSKQQQPLAASEPEEAVSAEEEEEEEKQANEDSDSDDVDSEDDLENLVKPKQKTASRRSAASSSSSSRGIEEAAPSPVAKKANLKSAAGLKSKAAAEKASPKAASKRKNKSGKAGGGKDKRAKLAGVNRKANPFGGAKLEHGTSATTPKNKALGSFFAKGSA